MRPRSFVLPSEFTSRERLLQYLAATYWQKAQQNLQKGYHPPPRDLEELQAKYTRITQGIRHHQLEALLHYRTGRIEKKIGGFRVLRIPGEDLKWVQHSLYLKLLDVYESKTPFRKSPAHGFLRYKTICTNAYAHRGREFVANIDLKDFFPSINRERIAQVLSAAPLKISHEVLEIILDYSIDPEYGNLPQGSPLSPLLSNFAATNLDRRLKQFAIGHDLVYTRYADDLTFSSRNEFDRIAFLHSVTEVIEKAGFRINARKNRFYGAGRKPVVTGLIVTNRLNLPVARRRWLRACLHGLQTKSVADCREITNEWRRGEGLPEFATDLSFLVCLYGHFKFWQHVEKFNYQQTGDDQARQKISQIESCCLHIKHLLSEYRVRQKMAMWY